MFEYYKSSTAFTIAGLINQKKHKITSIKNGVNNSDITCIYLILKLKFVCTHKTKFPFRIIDENSCHDENFCSK